VSEIIQVEILYPEGGSEKHELSQYNIESIKQYEDGTLGIIKRAIDGEQVTENYPEHRIHKVVWRDEVE
jgi:hypothetical protein